MMVVVTVLPAVSVADTRSETYPGVLGFCTPLPALANGRPYTPTEVVSDRQVWPSSTDTSMRPLAS
ncbi:MAG: hypothetical protein JWN52_7777 [Actinomycetia bacterium]|nr:hypothetical protein [Actinomycetes bacterium]